MIVNSHVRRPQENGIVERFHRTLKQELLDYLTVDNLEELNNALYEYVIKILGGYMKR